MKLSSISGVTCLVKDIPKTAAFYAALGFRIGKQTETTLTCYVNWFWIEFIAENAPEYQTEAQLTQRGAGTYLHIKVDNADECHAGLLAQGMQPEGEPQGSKSTGRSFILRDPDGYKLVFFEKK